MYQTQRSERLKVNALQKWKVLESESGRSKELVDLKEWIETVSRGETGQSQGMIVNGRKGKNWKFLR